MDCLGWLPHDAAPALAPDEVHVWRARLDVGPARRARLVGVLDQGERRRAGRYRFDRDRDRFVVRRGVLRTLLGGYLGLPAAVVGLRSDAYGKPAVADVDGERRLRFNLSHSDGLGLFAFSAGRDVGVDVERVEAERAEEGIAQRFFAAGEIAALAALPDEQWVRGFFECWTRKEAFVKAVGVGLSLPLDAFEVTVRPGEPARLIGVRDSEEPARAWMMTAFAPSVDHAAALVVRGRVRVVRRLSYRNTDFLRPRAVDSE